MTREQARALEASEVWKGWRDEGKVMQVLDTNDLWKDDENPQYLGFLAHPNHYRLKPEPKRRWIVVYPDGSEAVWRNQEVAQTHASRWNHSNVEKATVVEVVEVIK